MRKAENAVLNFLSWTPIVWITFCYCFYLLNFNPRIFGNETLDEYFLYWFLRYFVLIGIPLWLILMIYKGVAGHWTRTKILIHVLLFMIGFAILYLMMELNPGCWVNIYFD